jgi:hypothetical protein
VLGEGHSAIGIKAAMLDLRRSGLYLSRLSPLISANERTILLRNDWLSGLIGALLW